MKFIPIDHLVPGTRVMRNVSAKDGRILFPVGEVLSQDSIEELRSLGVTSIVGAPPEGSTEAAYHSQSQTSSYSSAKTEVAALSAPTTGNDVSEIAQEILSQKFSQCNLEDPYQKMLYTIAEQRINQRLLNSPSLLSSAKISGEAPAYALKPPAQYPLSLLVEKSFNMGTLPMVFHQLVEVVNDVHASTADVAKVISTDPALSAKLLRLVNSPFYGLTNKIDTISRAVTLVGTGQLLMLAMGATLMTAFNGIPVTLVNMQSFWNHSLACGIAAQSFAKHKKLGNIERFFVAGLLHDIGKLLVYSQLPKHALYLLSESRRLKTGTNNLEMQVLGFTHAELGAELLKIWRCPQDLIRIVNNHHANLATTEAGPGDIVINVANIFVLTLDFGSNQTDSYLPEIPKRSWEALGIVPDDIPAIVQDIERIWQSTQALLPTN